MRRPIEIEHELLGVSTVTQLTAVFEGIASMRIGQIKDQVVQSQNFFDRLWQMYTQIRVGNYFHFGRKEDEKEIIDKELLIAITAEGGFSGDVDIRLIRELLKYYSPEKNEIIVIGHHGAIQLAQHGVHFLKYFKMPAGDQNINVVPIVQEVGKFKSTSVFYQSYESLMVQQIKRISLSTAVEERGREVEAGKEVITEQNFIFEPSAFAVVDHLERSMMNIALSQTILESKLAQYASRFRAMSSANDKSSELEEELGWTLAKARREVKDERLREILGGIKKSHGTVAS